MKHKLTIWEAIAEFAVSAIAVSAVYLPQLTFHFGWMFGGVQ